MIMHRPAGAPPRPAGRHMANALVALPSGERAAPLARRVVVKLGTAVLTAHGGGLARGRVAALVASLVALQRSGREVLLVSSGAIRLGAGRLAAPGGRAAAGGSQACAAVGQARLMACYAEVCDRLGVAAAQLLLTAQDFARPSRRRNLRATLLELLTLGALPVINENDAVSAPVFEVEGAGSRGDGIGDNDRLAALVAAGVGADLLLILTDVPGLFTADPRGPGDARLIPVVRRVTARLARAAGGPRLGGGRGGMRSKLEAARLATRAGCGVVVADGRQPGVVERVCAGESVGTLFVPRRAAAAGA